MADNESMDLFDHPGSSRSKVWPFFGFKLKEGVTIKQSKNDIDFSFTYCRKCRRKYKYNGNTTNMSFHLDHEHRGWLVNSNDPRAKIQPKITDFKTSSSLIHRPLTADKKAKIDSALVNFIIDGLLPYSIVEKQSFQKFIGEIDERYNLPGRKLVLTHIDKLYEKTKGNLCADLKGVEVAITHDAWTSANTQSYDTVTVHYINDNWNLKCAVLRTELFPGSHTGENIANNLQATIDKWKLPEPISVTDNAANERKAFEILGYQRVGCYGHKINLIVKSGLNLQGLSNLIAKGRSLVTYFHQSPLAMNILFEKQKLLLSDRAQGHKLIQDVPTRWNSTLDMLQRLTEQTPALHATVTDSGLGKKGLELRKKVYSFEEASIVDSLIDILAPFKKATIELSAEKTPTHHLVLPVMKKLESTLQIKADDIPVIVKMKNEMSKQLNTRFSLDLDVALLASLLSPSTKYLNFVSVAQRDRAKKLLLDQIIVTRIDIKQEKDDADNRSVVPEPPHLQEEPPLPQPPDRQQEPPLPQPPDFQEEPHLPQPPELQIIPTQSKLPLEAEPPAKKSKKDTWLDDVIFCGQSNSTVPVETLALQESERYFAVDQANVNPLEWWERNHVFFPRIAKTAQKYLAVPASSVSSERIFSLAGNLINKKRSRLKPDNVDKMVFLHKNKEFM